MKILSIRHKMDYQLHCWVFVFVKINNNWGHSTDWLEIQKQHRLARWWCNSDLIRSTFYPCEFFFFIIHFSEGEPDYPNIIQLSSSGSSIEEYPGSLGEYQLLQDRDHNNRPVYQSLASEGRYIIYIGNIYSLKYHNIDRIIHARISLVHHAWYFQ